MANKKVIETKAAQVDEIAKKMQDASSYVFFEYRGLTVTETDELRRKLRENNSELKIYKNTLSKRALDKLNINLDEHLQGPKAIVFGEDQVSPVKTLAEFAKEHKALEIKVGVVDGEVADREMLDKLATIPSRDGLLTMLAAGLMAIPKDLAISLDLYAKQLEEK